MIDLSQASDLPISLDPASGLLRATSDLVLLDPVVRRLGGLGGVLAEPRAALEDSERPCYLLYRGLHLQEDASRFEQHGLRYDITVTLPGFYGRELAKTAGHYHGRSPGGVAYPEVYEVLHGHAMFVLQRLDNPDMAEPSVRSIWIAGCSTGDAIVIPPDCGHVTVNTGASPLVVSDLVAAGCENHYGGFRSLRGAAVYVEQEAGGNVPIIVANPRYGSIPQLQRWNGSRTGGLLGSDPIYLAFRRNPEKLAFLTAPASTLNSLMNLWP